MILKDYQTEVVRKLVNFFNEAEKQKNAIEKLDETLRNSISYVDVLYNNFGLSHFGDRPKNGLNKYYPRVCLKIPTGGGKTLLAIEAIREYQNIFAKKRTGLVVWITHRETIYRQTIEKLRDKNHAYRQLLDQSSGNRTIILEKGQPLRKDDIENNLVVLMLMIQSASRSTKENMKIFQDSGGYIDFFPQDNQYDLHKELLEKVPNLDYIPDTLFNKKIVKTSMGNAIRICEPLIIVDEFHTMFSDVAKNTLDNLNPTIIIGLSATPKERRQMNVLIEVTGRQLEREDMIKLEMHLHSPTISGNWHEVINEIKKKRKNLERESIKLNGNKGIYIRPIALIQAERTGKDQRESGKVHSEDIREYLINSGVPSYEIAVKSSELDEIKEEKLLSETSEIRYIITKEALKEGWDCSFAYILGVIPNARSESSMTQLVGRILRQPYAKKTGVKELDESYVYFNSGDSLDVLRNIQKGFEQEGLEDLVQNITPESGPTGSRRIKTKIKHQIQQKYPESLYLPVWIIKEQGNYRKFSYEIDIKPKIRWKTDGYKEWLVKSVFPLLDDIPLAYELLINLGKKYEKTFLDENKGGIFEVSYLSRRMAEVIENAFISFDLAENLLDECKKYKNQEKLLANSGFVTQQIVNKLREDILLQEQEIFESLTKQGKLSLTVSADENIGFMLPEEIEVYPEGIETYNLNLFEKSDILSMNPFERKIANLLDNKNGIIWWTRNIVDKKWYAIRGWKKGKIRPDFVIAKKRKDDSLELVYVIESKGEHLIDNPDTKYKMNVFNKMNQEKIKDIKLNLLRFKLNNNFRFELIEQNDEEMKTAKLFNN